MDTQVLESMNPPQRAIYEQLCPEAAADGTVYPDHLARDIRAYIDAQLAPHRSDETDGLWIGKSKLTAIHDCEGRWAAGDGGPVTLPMVQGTLTHMAIARLVMSQYRHIDDPSRVVTDALRRLRDDDYRKDRWEFLNTTCTEDDLDELVSVSIGHLITFIADWPRLPATWQPNTELRRSSFALCDGAVVLGGQYDLAIGSPVGMQAQRRIIDMKSRGKQAAHAADAQFYALLETLRQGVPPHIVGTYYFDTGVLDVAAVDQERLHQAADRLIDGVRKMWAVQAGRDPDLNPSGFCPYCPAHSSCDPGLRFIALREHS